MVPETTTTQSLILTQFDVFMLAAIIGVLIGLGVVMFIFPHFYAAHKKKMDAELLVKRKDYFEMLTNSSKDMAKTLNNAELKGLQQAISSVGELLVAPYLELHCQRIKMAELLGIAKTAEVFIVSPEGKKDIKESIPASSKLINLGSVYTEGDDVFYNNGLTMVVHNDGTLSLFCSDGTNLGVIHDQKGRFMEWIKKGENKANWDKV